MAGSIQIRPIVEDDRPWVRSIHRKWWGAESLIIRKTRYEPAGMDGFIAIHNDEKVGLVILRYEENLCEIISLTIFDSNPLIGKQLIQVSIQDAKDHASTQMIVVTTNDNTGALRFYQQMGFRLRELRVGIVEESRKLKPEIPLEGKYHIPIRDELELELILCQ